MPEQREVRTVREAAERLATQAEPTEPTELSDEEWDTLNEYLGELVALPGANPVAEQHALSVRWAGTPLSALVERAMHQLADAERESPQDQGRAWVAAHPAPITQPSADRSATGEPGAAPPTVEAPASDVTVSPNGGQLEPMPTIVGKPKPERTREPLPLYSMPHPQAWPSVGGGLFLGDRKQPTTTDGTPLEPRPRPQERDP